MSDIDKYDVVIEGTVPLLQHRFNGQDEDKKNRELSEDMQAEKHAYRDDKTEELYIPQEWVRGSIIDGFKGLAGRKEVQKERNRIASRLRITPMKILLGKKTYDIDKRPVPSGKIHGGTRDFCIRPIINNWKAKFSLETTNDIKESRLKEVLDYAGREVGMGSNRPNGYGRFMVLSIKKNE